jgi:galactokinase
MARKHMLLNFWELWVLTFVDKYSTEKVPKSFPQENLKKLASQTENNYFGVQTLKIDYAVNVCVFPR